MPKKVLTTLLDITDAIHDVFNRCRPAMPTQDEIDAVLAEFEGDGVNMLTMATEQFNREQAMYRAGLSPVIAGVPGHGNCTDCGWHNKPEGCNVERDSATCRLNKRPLPVDCPVCGSALVDGKCTQPAKDNG